MKIAITGMIASGKSTITAELARLGWLTLQTDKLAHECARGPDAQTLLREWFGGELPANDKFRARFFADVAFRRAWEGVVHSGVRRACEAAQAAQPEANWAVELPLLYENKLEGGFDAVIVSHCQPSVALERWEAKGRKKEDYGALTNLQLPIAEKLRQTPYQIENNRSLDALLNEVHNLHINLLRHVGREFTEQRRPGH